MSEHTPGKLTLEEVASDSGHIKHLCPVDSEGMSLLTVVEHEGVKFAAIYNDDDARRFMACWNACEGLTTEDLENLSSVGEGLKRQTELAYAYRSERDSLRAVNAELLEALKSSRAVLCTAFKAVAPDLFDSDEAVSEHLQIRRIDAAIASARKQGEQG